MVAVSAIVTGLPGGTIEKNRNADLLSPGALVDGTLGNRVTITRTNPGDRQGAVARSAIVRTRADGGLVLQTEPGVRGRALLGPAREADVRPRSGGPSGAAGVQRRHPRSATAGLTPSTLTYLAWGFDWQAHYVATLGGAGPGRRCRLRLMSWLTLLNDNGQSFPDAELMVVAGTAQRGQRFRRPGRSARSAADLR